MTKNIFIFISIIIRENIYSHLIYKLNDFIKKPGLWHKGWEQLFKNGKRLVFSFGSD